MTKKLLTVRIDEEKLEAFRVHCETMGTSMSESIQFHINQCLGIETPISSIEELKNNFDDDLRKLEVDVKRQCQRITENQYSIGLLLERIGQLEGKIDNSIDKDRQGDRIDNNIDNDKQVDKIDNDIDSNIDNSIDKDRQVDKPLTVRELKSKLDDLGIPYKSKDSKAKLIALLES